MWPSHGRRSRQIYDSITVYLHLHNFKTAVNLFWSIKSHHVCLCAVMRSVCNLLSAFLKPQFLMIVVALISDFVDKIKVINNDNNYRIASSKSTINYTLPTCAKKNKVREKERKLHYLSSCFCLLTSRGVVKSWSFLFLHVVVFSVNNNWIPKDVIMPCTAKTENNTNANILKAELFKI